MSTPTPIVPLSELSPDRFPTLTVPQAGAYLGLDRDAAYRAAQQGYLPTLKLGVKAKVVPTAVLLDMLTGNADR